MNWTTVETILQREIGLDARSIGASAIESAVRTRQAECGLTTLEAYLEKLQSSPLEIKKLIEEVTVPETWFFRVREAFAFLARHFAGKRFAADFRKPLRLLSVPCSTGEEPYSMAIALLDAGFSPEDFHIDALDINLNALETAKRARYGNNSFREEDLAFRDEYFLEEEKQQVRLKAHVAASVSFQHGNLVAPGFLAGAALYDVVFCRNLLIYLEQPARLKAVNVLKRLLVEGGLLFVGHAEALPLIESRFTSARQAGAFAYYNLAPETETARAVPPPAARPRPPAPPAPITSPAPLSRPAPPTPPAPCPVEENPLEQARRLADQGDLDRAVRCCEKAIEKEPLDYQPFLLLGVIALAQKDSTAAERHFRKVLYLDAHNEEAIRHLIAIHEHSGRHEAAERLKQRIRRVAAENATDE